MYYLASPQNDRGSSLKLFNDGYLRQETPLKRSIWNQALPVLSTHYNVL